MAIQQSPTWLGRVYQFNKQMFPLFPNVFVFFAQFTASYLVLSKLIIHQKNPSTMVLEIFIGSISLMFYSYLFRCFDEVKDYESDKINFPDRPLVVGVMSLKDMYILQIVVIVTLLLINLFFVDSSDVHLTFGAVLIFTILARFWFFAEKWIKPSLPLALLTHNPVAYLHQLYILSFFSLSYDVVFGREGLLLVSIGFLATAWEISRKIRGTEQEDAYTTYSKVWGPRIPPVLVSALLTGSFLTTGYLIGRQGTPWMILLWLIPLAALLRLYAQSFQFIKDSRKAPAFRLSVESYAFATIVVLVISYFII